MKKFVKGLLATAVFSVATVASSADVLKIGVEGAYPPFSKVNDAGEVIGFDIDIANALCAELKRECKLVQVDWDGLIPSLMSRKIDAIIASMNATEERKKSVDFTDKYYQIPAKFVRKKGNSIELTKEGMKGKVVALQRATIFENYVKGEFPDVEIKSYNTNDEALLDLKAGRADAVIAESLALVDGLLKVEGGDDYELFGPDLTDEKYFGTGAAIAVRKGDAELQKQFNAAIQAILSSGKYKEINDQYFEFGIYGK